MTSKDRHRTRGTSSGALPAAVGSALAAACALSFGACGEEFQAAPPDATTTTSTGTGGCSGGTEACGDTCVDLASDPDNCGECGRACPPISGERICAGGICQMPMCPEGYGDCDMDPEHTCETDLKTDRAHCGGCEMPPCSGQCVEGSCEEPIGVAAGADYTCAVMTDFTVWCWGRNEWGNLGNGLSGEDVSVPGQVEGVDAVQVAAGAGLSRTHTCAVQTDGTVACWGAGSNGQLGGGNNTGSNLPITVEGFTEAARISVGATHTCAVKESGVLSCWGQAGFGQLGYGDIEDKNTPELILDGVSAVGAGEFHTCARTGNDERMRCWGGNTWGQLGVGTFRSELSPALVASLLEVEEIAVGARHSCARTADGKVWCWGEGASYRLGTGTTSPEAVPREIQGLQGALQLVLGSRHSGAVIGDERSVVMWGDNAQGQLGNGTQDPALVPQPIGLTDVAMLSLGDDHSCALKRSGELLCWGDNTNGQLGDGTKMSRTTPTPVVWPERR